jgi:enamine deaminase RidA (YjgF/YER057c/UK114 family)
VWLAAFTHAHAADPTKRHVRAGLEKGSSAAVVVKADAALVHTAQLLPLDDSGRIVGPDRVDVQVEAVLDRLETVLNRASSGLGKAVKLSVALARADVLPTVREALSRRLGQQEGPALSVVVGELARPGAVVAIDAVALTASRPPAGLVERPSVPGLSGQFPVGPLAVLPAGPRVYVSGQAEPGPDLATATRKTLQSLEATLKSLGL